MLRGQKREVTSREETKRLMRQEEVGRLRAIAGVMVVPKVKDTAGLQWTADEQMPRPPLSLASATVTQPWDQGSPEEGKGDQREGWNSVGKEE